MVEKDAGDKGKEKEPSNVTPPFSEEQVAFLRTLLEERVPPPVADKGKGPAKRLTNESEKPTNDTEKPGEDIALEYQ